MINWFFDQRDRWFFWLPVFLGAGAALYFALPIEPPLFLLALIPCLVFAILTLRRFEKTRLLVLAVFLFALGFAAAQMETRLDPPVLLDQAMPPSAISGLVFHLEALPDGASRLTLLRPRIKGMGEKTPSPELVRIKIAIPYAEAPQAGQLVSLWGPLWPPGESLMPEGFNFRRHAYFLGLGASGVNYGQLRQAAPLVPLSWSEGGLSLLFEKARRFFSLAAMERVKGDEGAMTSALLTGGQGVLSREVMTAMRASGLSHLLSISGLHVSMVALLIFLPLRFLLSLWPWFALRFSTKKTAAFFAICMTALYAALIGPEAPVLRSALMSGCVMLAVLTDRRSQSLRLVALAAFVLLLFRPSFVLSPSFQLSFAAVLAMVAAFEKRLDAGLQGRAAAAAPSALSALPRPIQSAARALRDTALTSLLATAATAPLTLYHFQTLNLYGVFANMLAIPLTTLWVMPLLLATYVAAPFGLAGLFLDAAGWGCALVIQIAKEVASWPFAALDAPPMPLWALGGFSLALLWLCLWRGRVRWLGLAPALIACAYPFFFAPPSVFVAGNGKDWAVLMEDGTLAAYGKRNETFALRGWKRASMADTLDLFSAQNPPPEPSPLRCNGSLCLYEKPPIKAAFLARRAKEAEIEQACAKADFVFAPIPLPACKAAHVLDAPRLRFYGAASLSAEKGKASLKLARPHGPTRPWQASAALITEPTASQEQP